jgi:transcriptional regulator with XRE-family HTH domain
MKGNDVLGRIALAIPETRAELGLSMRQLEQLSGVNRGTISRLESGAPVPVSTLMRLAVALTVAELHMPAKPEPEPELAAGLLSRLPVLIHPRRRLLAQPEPRALGGAA